jgi:hypothetical protein
LQVYGTTMWGTRKPPEWLARRWNRKHHNKPKGESEGESEGESKCGEGEYKAEGHDDPEGSTEAGEDVEAGVQRRASSWGPTGIRLPPVPKVQLPEVSPASTVAVRVIPS